MNHRFTDQEAAPLIDFVNERHAIYLRKSILEDQAAQGAAYPKLSETGRLAWGKGGWNLHRLTEDTILNQYRFCNVFRQLDRVTQWITEHISIPYADHPHLWYMLACARFINWPPTLDFLIDGRASWPGHPRFDPKEMTAALEAWKRGGNKVETGAYMIRAESDAKKEWYSWTKQRYVSEIVLGKLWADRDKWQGIIDGGGRQPSLEGTWDAFRDKSHGLTGWGSFMAGQVVADLRWTRYLEHAPDVGRWAPLGPGSTRGLNRLAGRLVGQSIPQVQGLAEMLELQRIVNNNTAAYVPAIELADVQSCLCEVDKYLRAQTNGGRPRSLYVPGRGS